MRILRNPPELGTYFFLPSDKKDEEVLGLIAHNVLISQKVDFLNSPSLIPFSKKDKKEAREIQKICALNSGLIFLGDIPLDGKRALVFTAGFCQKCRMSIAGLTSYKLGLCCSCAKKEKHENNSVRKRGVHRRNEKSKARVRGSAPRSENAS